MRNLELYQSSSENGKSLCDVIDHTVSPMGSRLLKRWLALPLKNVAAIEERLDAVSYFIEQDEKRNELRSVLKETGDLERLISKVAAFKQIPVNWCT
jgi:DNA mismatch repair protein MutS